jgi:hypothetical protein
MELLLPAATSQFGGNLIDALSDNEHWTVDRFREKISQRPIETAGEENALAVLDYQRKGSIDRQNGVEITSEQPAPSLRFVDRPEAL